MDECGGSLSATEEGGLLTDCVHPPGFEDQEVVLLLAQFVPQTHGDAVSRERWTARTPRHQKHQTGAEGITDVHTDKCVHTSN